MRISKAITISFLIFILAALSACRTDGPFIPKENIPAKIKPQVRKHIEKLYSSRPQVRADNANALAKMRKEAIRSVPFLIALLGDKESAIDTMGKMKTDHFNVSVAAARALGYIGSKRAVKHLVTARKEGNIGMKIASITALTRIGDPALDALIEALKDKDEFVRKYAAEALGIIGDEAAVEPLIDALKDEYAPVRENAVFSLDLIGDPDAVDGLIIALKDDIPLIKSSAARTLGKMGDHRAIEPLIDALLDPSYSVKSSASAALNTLTGKDYGHDKRKWKRWWEKNKFKFELVPIEEEFGILDP
jgi:HEAT repeat protein